VVVACDRAFSSYLGVFPMGQNNQAIALVELLPQLREKLPPEYHGIRKLPGGAQWVYVPWRSLVTFLNDTCLGEWEVQYSDPQFIEPLREYKFLKSYCIIKCGLTIGGVTRWAPGTAPLEMISNSGNDMAQGDPVERATADAFRSACEMFEVGVYLHRQAKDKSWQQKLISWVNNPPAQKEAA
jgi:hypothetical protein